MKLTRRSAMMTAGAFAAVTAARPSHAGTRRFSMNFAPHEGSFASRGDRLAQIAHAADLGFSAWEDNKAGTRSIAEQDAMARALARHRMTMGVFVASLPRWNEFRPLLGGDDDGDRQRFLMDIRNSVDVAKRLDARWVTVVPGFLDFRVPIEVQTARVIDTMRRAAAIMEPHNIVMVMEPLNTRTDHPQVFLQTVSQGYGLARAVNSPSVKILADLYHEQIQSGNLIPTLETCWNEIAYIQFGDNPGRKEPGTGEINYANICRWLKDRGYAGVIGMEHGNSVDGVKGEAMLAAAYRAIDPT